MDHDYNAIAPDAEPTPEELRFFREKLTAPDGLTLPASLTAEALFQRLDEGALSLPEDNTNTPPEQTIPAESTDEEPSADESRKVIPWEKALRRWLPIAACLAVVLLLYQGQQTAMARNFSTSTAKSAPSSAAYSLTQEALTEDVPAESEEASTQAPAAPAAPAPEPSSAAPAENGNARKAYNGENQFDTMEEGTDSSADTAKSKAEDRYLNSGVSGPTESSATEDDQDHNPPTGGGNPTESSSADSANEPMTGDGEPALSPRTLAIRAEAEKLADANAPANCTYTITAYTWGPEEDQVSFDAVYRSADDQNAGTLTFLCQIHETEQGGKDFWLEVLSCQASD